MATLDKMQKWAGDLQQTLLSLVKIPLKSRKPSALPQNVRNTEELVILANGPSLNKTVTDHRDFLDSRTLLAVNFCATSPMFTELKPELYLIADPLFWIVDEKRESLFGALAEKTGWKMHLFMPSRSKVDAKWQEMLKKNPNITVHIYNTTPVEGFRVFTDFVYRKGLGMPRPHNVLIPSIAMALRMPFKKIYLAGADHSWLPEITVTENNEVLMHQKHFYDKGTSKADTVKQENLSTARLYTILYHMHVAFKAYFTLRDFAAKLGKSVINITPGSYIDAFERMKLTENTCNRDGIVIQARSGSTRMPSKILRAFGGETRIIDIIIEKIKKSCPDKTIVVATTDNPSDNIIADIAKSHKVECFRGSEDDVLARFIGAADKFGLERIIRVCSDNPFMQTDTFRELFDAQSASGADYVAFAFPDGRPTIKSHLGLYAELATVDALRKAAAATDEKLYHEHVTIYLYTHPQEFKIGLLPLPEFLQTRTDLRLTLDTPSDFALLQELYSRHLTETGGSLKELIDIVDSEPRYHSVMKENIAQNEK